KSQEGLRVPYHVKVYWFVAVAVMIMAAGVLLAWAYMEVQHQVERTRLMECIRKQTVTDGVLPAQAVIDANIQHCDGQESWLFEVPAASTGAPRD
ncbi:hypothetical protein C6A85_74260, partial [Mycobacterium sp. ITM-2017-0098]